MYSSHCHLFHVDSPLTKEPKGCRYLLPSTPTLQNIRQLATVFTCPLPSVQMLWGLGWGPGVACRSNLFHVESPFTKEPKGCNRMPLVSSKLRFVATAMLLDRNQ